MSVVSLESVIRSHSSDRRVEPQYQSPAHTCTQPITSQSQLSIMVFFPVFVA